MIGDFWGCIRIVWLITQQIEMYIRSHKKN